VSNDGAATTASRTTAPDGTIGITGPWGLVIPVIPPGKTLPLFLVPAIAMKIDEPADCSAPAATLANFTLADLVNQLGPPPHDVLQRWYGAAQDMLDQVEPSSSHQGLPSPELRDLRWSVSGTIEPISPDRQSLLSQQDWMTRFRAQLLENETESTLDAEVPSEVDGHHESVTGADVKDTIEVQTDSSIVAKPSSQNGKRLLLKNTKRTSIAVAGAIVAIVCVASGLLWFSPSSQPTTASKPSEIKQSTDAIQIPQRSQNQRSQNQRSQNQRSQTKGSGDSDQSDDDLPLPQRPVEFEDVTDVESSTPKQIDVSLGSQTTSSLTPLPLLKSTTNIDASSDRQTVDDSDSDLQGSQATLSADLTNPLLRPIDPAISQSTQEPDAEIALNSALLKSDQSKPIDELFEATPSESTVTQDQATTSAAPIDERQWRSAVSLIETESLGDGVMLTDSPVQSLSLESVAKESEIRIQGNSPTWQIHAKDSTIASMSSGEKGLLFQWSPEAHRTPVARELQQSRLRVDGKPIFLRLPITADPMRIRFDDVDQNPAWDLMMPVVTHQTKLASRFELPQSVDVSWIEPIATDAFRNGRALAILTSNEDDESYALGVRADFNCGRKFTCRLRYAARLDPNMPWQPISRNRLAQYAAELTGYASLISREAERLARMNEIAYDIAGRRGKQIITQKTIRNNALKEQVETAIKRISQLQGLMARIENEAALHFCLTTVWPDEEQSILRVGDTSPKP
jgi:hypothetical protein